MNTDTVKADPAAPGITLDLKAPGHLPIEAEALCPDRFLKLNHEEICRLPLLTGRRSVPLGDLFQVKGERSDHITINGDLARFKHLGHGMTRGTLCINGNAGMHLGDHMAGGEIRVSGKADNWVGAHMKGGFIHIKGDAGHYAGAAYVGEKRGTNQGILFIEGNAGIETGARMRRGLIVVKGNTGDFTGAHLIAGTIMVLGQLGEMPGPGNRRGSIVALGEAPERLLPTYGYQCCHQPVFLRLYTDLFRKWGLDPSKLSGRFQRYAGDINHVGKGEVLIHDPH